MSAYYNEHDPFAAAWLRELIAEGLIAEGEVDDRDIQTVTPADVRGFDQCHWFAGIGGWSYALRLAGWPDDRAVWTGSCPCQPFSAAGARAGGHDPRDLWPAWFELIRECRPATIVGEQVAAAVAHSWIDRVANDLEGRGYAVGAACLPAASVGAFHLRNRLWFVAESNERGREGARLHLSERGPQQAVSGPAGTSADDELGDTDRSGSQGRDGRELSECADQCAPWTAGDTQRMADTERDGWRTDEPQREAEGRTADGRISPWSDVLWLPCRDGKTRPTEPGLLPLAHGVPGRVGTLRGAGNAIVPQVAAEFIRAYAEARGLT